jgi:hypothetical protein
MVLTRSGLGVLAVLTAAVLPSGVARAEPVAGAGADAGTSAGAPTRRNHPLTALAGFCARQAKAPPPAVAGAPVRRGFKLVVEGGTSAERAVLAGSVAAASGKRVERVALAAVVGKYAGETEKNLKGLFARAESLDVVLYFDEADALFGKRSEVKDAHDRYANQEVDYLLQRIEAYEGLVVLASNARVDDRLRPEVTRRLQRIVNASARNAELWRTVCS